MEDGAYEVDTAQLCHRDRPAGFQVHGQNDLHGPCRTGAARGVGQEKVVAEIEGEVATAQGEAGDVDIERVRAILAGFIGGLCSV